MILSAYPGALDALFPAWDLDSIQALGFDASGRPLVCDGKEGPLTRGGRFLVPDGDEPAHVREALAFVRRGIQESEGNNRGADIDEMFGAPGSVGAWCAAFVSRAVINARSFASFRLIKGARRLTDWWAARGAKVSAEDIAVGDIISWAVPREDVPYGGHVGIVCHVDGDLVYVVEGNGGAKKGRARVYCYSRAADLVYGRDKNPVWLIVRPR